MHTNHFLIVSKPRSGSTILTRTLDEIEDVLCLPECFFPHVLEYLNQKDFMNKRRVAALYVASCPDGSPLSIDEAESCIGNTPKQTLELLATAVARKFGRDPQSIRCVVWKSTRMVGAWKFWSNTGWRFVILSRNPLNVYESQFRVHFGSKNQNPFRFALFDASYNVAFSKYPKDRTLALAYEAIPERTEELLQWMSSSGVKRNSHAIGGVQQISGSRYWHTNIDKPFFNDDDSKLQRLSTWQRVGCKLGIFMFSLSPRLASLARLFVDKRQMNAISAAAERLMKQNPSTS